MRLILIGSLLPFILTQNPSCSTGNNIPTFSNCDVLTDPSGQVGPNDITSACASLSNDQTTYYKCLCDKSTGVVGCYSSFCANDVGMNSATQYQIQFCGAVQNINALTSTTTAVTVSKTTTTTVSTSTETQSGSNASSKGSKTPLPELWSLILLVCTV